MTGMSGRCRRHHQNQCEGPAAKGLCVRHREQWEAMQADWQARADATPPPPQSNAWTPAEDDIIRTNTPKQAAQLLPHRTLIAIGGRRTALSATTAGWTKAEDDIVRNNSLTVACELLPGRTYKAVSTRRRVVGVVRKNRKETK